MFFKLFQALRMKGVPVTLREHLDLLEGLNSGLCQSTYTDEFYNFSRICLIKDEKLFDRFDLVFGEYFAERKQGVIVNFSSASSQQALSRVLGYSNAKAAVDNLTRWMATDFAQNLIRNSSNRQIYRSRSNWTQNH